MRCRCVEHWIVDDDFIHPLELFCPLLIPEHPGNSDCVLQLELDHRQIAAERPVPYVICPSAGSDMPDSGSGVKMSPDLPMRLLATFWHREHVARTVSFI